LLSLGEGLERDGSEELSEGEKGKVLHPRRLKFDKRGEVRGVVFFGDFSIFHPALMGLPRPGSTA